MLTCKLQANGSLQKPKTKNNEINYHQVSNFGICNKLPLRFQARQQDAGNLNGNLALQQSFWKR
jgi:hypothetical protein